ncbi:MAG: Mfa1 fimbrilin C-terminal domain-containing protein [Bacteroidaceae bacterium]|nr:Mfa1 fimbrilin C-terminal domain-containing protein [Bacteroidaceae bacterium]
MKLRHLLFGLLAGVAFVACTNDDDPAGVTPVNGDKVATADKYISVNLVMPDGAATRAIDDDGTQAGVGAENVVKKAVFLFFKGEEQIAAPFPISVGGNDANNEAWNTQDDAVIVMKNPTAIPDALVVLINYDGTVEGKTLTQLKADKDNFAKDLPAEGKFVMSNSVYYDAAGNEVIGAPVTPADVYDDPGDAKDSPVTVNVERVVAKVTVEKASNATINSGVAGIDIEINGWGLVYENTKSYLIKNLKSSYNFGANWAKWNEPDKFRSYWADAPYDANNAANTTWADATNPLGTTPVYTQENVMALPQKTIENGGKPTAVVVAATLKYKASEEAEAKAVDLFKTRGIVYDTDNLITLMSTGATPKKYFKDGTTAGTYVSLDPTDYTLEFVENPTGIESYEAQVYLQLASTVTKVYTFEGTTPTTITNLTSVNEDLATYVETVEYWQGGATYYYVPIVQNSALKVNVKKEAVGETPATYWGLFGVVRNHFYQLTINSIQGLGTAVPDPEQVIVPEIPEDNDYYIAAEINILDWKLVKQGVDLGK